MREIVFDTETTGFKPQEGHRMVEIACVELIDRLPTGKIYHTLINPQRDMPKEAYAIHGLSAERLASEPLFEAIYEEFLEFIGPEAPLVAHNARFDMSFVNAELKNVGVAPIGYHRVIDTLPLAKEKFPGSPSSLDALCKRFKISLAEREKHGALTDARLLADVYLELTGGRQNSLLLGAEQKRSTMVGGISSKFLASSQPRRFYTVSEEEKKHHQEFLKKLKNPVWLH